MDELTAFQRDALYVIAGLDEPNGLEIKVELDEYYSQEINHGHLYPISTPSSIRGWSERAHTTVGRTPMS